MSLMAQWMEEVRQICGPQVPVLLVGCKKDLRDEGARGGDDARFVSTAQVSAAELEERRTRRRRIQWRQHPEGLVAALPSQLTETHVLTTLARRARRSLSRSALAPTTSARRCATRVWT
jgi:GTPase SAR1 family protein